MSTHTLHCLSMMSANTGFLILRNKMIVRNYLNANGFIQVKVANLLYFDKTNVQ